MVARPTTVTPPPEPVPLLSSSFDDDIAIIIALETKLGEEENTTMQPSSPNATLRFLSCGKIAMEIFILARDDYIYVNWKQQSDIHD